MTTISKDAFQILKDTVSKDKTRYYIGTPYYDAEEKKIIATDVCRMAVINWEIEEFKKSTYVELIKTGSVHRVIKSDLDAQFPNWKRVLPDYSGETPIMEDFSFEGDNVADSRIFCDIVLEIGQAINVDWTIKTLKKVFIETLKKGPKEKNPLEFTFNQGVYILMPMRK